MNKKLRYPLLGLIFVDALCSSTLANIAPELQCRNTSGLPSGLTVVIHSSPTSDLEVAQISNRDNLGPYEELGTIRVYRRTVARNRMGGPITYLGRDFELSIFWDGGLDDGALPAYVYVDIAGRVFNEPMRCRYALSENP